MKLAALCTCCLGCDHPVATAPIGPDGALAEIEGQYGPCTACHESVSGKPRDGRPPLRAAPTPAD